MTTQLLTYIFVGASFALYIGIAIWSKAQSTNDFYVAGKGVHPVANGMATAADWMSAASFLSMAGLIAFLGKDGSVYLMAIKYTEPSFPKKAIRPAIDKNEAADIQSAAVAIPFATGCTPLPAT